MEIWCLEARFLPPAWLCCLLAIVLFHDLILASHISIRRARRQQTFLQLYFAQYMAINGIKTTSNCKTKLSQTIYNYSSLLKQLIHVLFSGLSPSRPILPQFGY